MSESNALKSVSYRYDLDGLRGVAIAFVVIFHVFVGRVSGGVDVFLLLSGYFFLGSQLRYADRMRASLNPWWPLWRTIRRLVPALVVVLASVSALVWWVVPSLKEGELVRQLLASLLYYQNWELASQDADYNVASDSVSPLQHLWSMSVQGQFYVGAIALSLGLLALLRMLKLRRTQVSTVAGPILILITIASFIYACILHNQDQGLNYYSTFSRAWELTLGAVLAIYGHRIQLNEKLRSVLAWLGLIMVLSTGLLFDGARVFPGPWTLYPLGGAVFIILGAGTVSTLLSRRSMRWLGDIAYSLYLWHWPLLILTVVYFELTEPSILLGLAVIAVSVGLAHLTYTFVEKPLRQHRARPKNDEYVAWNAFQAMQTNPAARLRGLGGASIATVFVLLLSMAPAYNQKLSDAEDQVLDPHIYPGARALSGAVVPADVDPQPDPELIGDLYPRIGLDRCMAFASQPPAYFPTTASNPDGEEGPCAYGELENFTKTIYLVGGSHAEQYSSVLIEIAKEEGWRIIPQLRQGCPLFLQYDGEYDADNLCARYNHKSLDLLLDAQPDLVLSTSTRPESLTGEGPDYVPEDYERVWELLDEAGIPFLGLRDNPWGWNEDGSPFNRTQCMAQGNSAEECGIDRDVVYSEEDPAEEILAGFDNMRSVDTSDWFCEDDFCPPVIGNVFVYRDHNHISAAYAHSLKEKLRAELKSMFADIDPDKLGDEDDKPTTTFFNEEEDEDDSED
ncbi:O-acetyltransferase OatA [Corynebacterium ciconiae DSM 44920]|uniref:acyltransferase family protein n=1 Tax=Corynebacterium ciconiae TaxID=227319 RepID=UPI00036D4CB6|nr:acyltransferase family protein [Corynebacterium ciconiae]WKD61495.1 O-acetyltransferase OatA [Corynebacterium ciconiae DSM 44920]